MSEKENNELSLIWQAAAANVSVNSQSKLARTVIDLDLNKCLDAIEQSLKERSNHSSSRESSLHFISNLMFGLCQVLALQSDHTYRINCNLIPSNGWQQAKETKQTKTRKGAKTIVQLDLDGPFTFKLIKLYQKQMNALERRLNTFQLTQPKITYKSETRIQRDKNLLPSFDDFQPNGELVTDADTYFQQLDDQMNSVHFMDECQSILDEHFRKDGKQTTPLRFEPTNFLTCSKETSPEKNEDCDSKIVSPVVTQEPIFEQESVQKTRKKRFLKPTRTRNTRQPGLKGFILDNEWRSGRHSYNLLKQELVDVQLNQASRSLPPCLQKHFTVNPVPVAIIEELPIETVTTEVDDELPYNWETAIDRTQNILTEDGESTYKPATYRKSETDEPIEMGDYKKRVVLEFSFDSFPLNTESNSDDELQRNDVSQQFVDHLVWLDSKANSNP